MNKAEEKGLEVTEVPCNGCTACCRGERIILDQDEVGKYDAIPTSMEADGKTLRYMLRHKQDRDKSCIYLGRNGCSIHGRQPRRCREFDCRKWLEIFSDAQIDKMLDDPMDGPTVQSALARRITTKKKR